MDGFGNKYVLNNVFEIGLMGSYHVLLSDVTLHKAVGMLVLEDLWVGEVVGVSIQGHHTLIVAA